MPNEMEIATFDAMHAAGETAYWAALVAEEEEGELDFDRSRARRAYLRAALGVQQASINPSTVDMTAAERDAWLTIERIVALALLRLARGRSRARPHRAARHGRGGIAWRRREPQRACRCGAQGLTMSRWGGFWIACGLVSLGYEIGHGLSLVARAIAKLLRETDLL